MYLAIKEVKTLENYKLRLTFQNQETREFDVSGLLNMGKFKELKDKAMFNSVKVSFDTIEWANKLDLDPEYLYEKSVPVAPNAVG